MELKLGATVYYFLWSLLTGVILAFLYDFIRSSRRIHKTSVFGVNLEDILFFLFAGLLMFWIAFDKNNGRIRLQGFLGVFLGFWGYRKIFRDKLVQFMVWLSGAVMTALVFLLKLLFFPIKILFQILSKPFLVIGWYSRQGMNRAETMARTLAKRQKMLKKAKVNPKKKDGKQKKNKEVKCENFR